MKGLSKVLHRFETMMTAISFAEAGEVETARAFMNEESRKKKVKRENISRRTDLSARPHHRL